ncbi:DUF4376 domain-containing protein [Salmonella enterica]|nr:DUF4376 domain-containing protein [Salmonella enterica]EIT2139853.1 DUF4376 domain-containing protein [Salmonella enterica]
MITLNNLTRYTPDVSVSGVIYLRDDNGNDWYESQSLFQEDTWKIAYDADGVICSCSQDVSMLYPINMSVTEVEKLPAKFEVDLTWRFDGENIVNSMTVDKAREQKTREIEGWRNAQESANYTFTFDNHKWDYGKATQERLTLSVQMAKANKLPAGFIWTDADNNDVPMTAGELLNLSDAIDQAMFTKGLQIHLRQREMKEEIDKLTDVKAILDYVVGWPDIPTK